MEKTTYSLSEAMLCMKVEGGYCLMSEIDDETFYQSLEFFDDAIESTDNLILILDYCMNTERIVPLEERTINSFTNTLFNLIPNKESRIEIYKALKKVSKRFFYETFARDLQRVAEAYKTKVAVTPGGNISIVRKEY